MESGHYRMAGAHTQADGAIQPAIYRNYWYDRCYWDCMTDCTDDPWYCNHNCDTKAAADARAKAAKREAAL
jgi:hypothetical protein